MSALQRLGQIVADRDRISRVLAESRADRLNIEARMRAVRRALARRRKQAS